MTVEFLCPNGHPLAAPASRAGKPGKCPKCQTAFIVPTMEEFEQAQEEVEQEEYAAQNQTEATLVDEPMPDFSQAAAEVAEAVNQKRRQEREEQRNAKAADDFPAEPAQAPAPAPKGLISFSCKNGHALNGPATLRGRVGQCPHCGSRFRVPEDAPIVKPKPTPPPAPQQRAPKKPSKKIVTERTIDEGVEEVPVMEALAAWQSPPQPPHDGFRLSDIFAWLWHEKDIESDIELVLKNGDRIKPLRYAPEVSRDDHALFAIANEEDKIVLTTMPWSDVHRVIVHNAGKLPGHVFR